jgi:DNA-binding GntR family transcriptional regulator
MPKPPLGDAIYQAVREDIIWGDLCPGTAVSEGELAAQHGVSKTPARQALARLCDDGLINLIPYRGYYVSQLSVKDALDLYETRLILELGAVDLAVRNASDSGLLELERLAQATRQEDPRERSRANSEFHLGIARLGGNARLEALVRSSLDLNARQIALDVRGGLDTEVQVAEHVQIARSLQRRDAAAAREGLRAHIETTRARAFKVLSWRGEERGRQEP